MSPSLCHTFVYLFVCASIHLCMCAAAGVPELLGSCGETWAIWCQNDVVSTSMRRDDVAWMLIRRHFYVMCLLGTLYPNARLLNQEICAKHVLGGNKWCDTTQNEISFFHFELFISFCVGLVDAK